MNDKNLQTLFLNQMVSRNLVLQNDATHQIIIFYLGLHVFYSLRLNVFVSILLILLLIINNDINTILIHTIRGNINLQKASQKQFLPFLQMHALLLGFVDTKSSKRHWNKIALEKIIRVTSYKLRFELHYNIRRQNWPADDELEQDYITHHQIWISLILCLNGHKSLQTSSWICSHME